MPYITGRKEKQIELIGWVNQCSGNDWRQRNNQKYLLQTFFEKMRKAKASSNPLLFCEGGCLVKLNPNDTIEEALKSATYSIGYIGLEEVSYLMTGKHLHQDNSFAIEVLEYLNSKIEKAKKETGKLIALYGTPKLLGL